MKRVLPLVILLAGMLGVGCCLSACSTNSPETGDQDEVHTAGTAAKRAFQADIEAYSRLLHLPALAVGVARGDSLIFFKGTGSIDSAGNTPPTADHVFPIASVANTFTAVALKQLEAEGKLSLQDPISSYPNQFFNENRWDAQTTLAHLLSHTSESDPHGTQFVYNGGKFNILLNVFGAISDTIVQRDFSRPFIREIQQRILKPLHMDHTLLRYTGNEYGRDLAALQSGPGYGMMSSVNDLVRYSSALGGNKLLTAGQYETLTEPFYPGSPYGLGWFTTRFEGTAIHWASGYNDKGAALLLRVPSGDLTLIVLSPCPLTSSVARPGYGNPFNSMLVCSFFSNFVRRDTAGSRLAVEAKFAEALTYASLPAALDPDTARAGRLLQTLMSDFPSDSIWQTSAAFELVAASRDRAALRFGLKMAKRYLRQNEVHPVKAWYAGLIYQKNGRLKKAKACFGDLVWGDKYREQPYKFKAMMELANWYKGPAPRHAKEILQELVRFKDAIGVRDAPYREAKQRLKALQKG